MSDKDLLSRVSKQFIFMDGDRTLFDALRMYNEQKASAAWFLVVDAGDKNYLVARFGALQEQWSAERTSELVNEKLKNLGDPFVRVGRLEQDTAVEVALEAAHANPAGLAVIVWGKLVIGVLDVAPVATVTEMVAHLPVEELDRADSIAVTVGDDVEGNLIVAGGDVTIESGQDKPTTRLGRMVAWVQSNPWLSVLGFLIFAVLPMAWFVYNDLLPTLNPEPMNGDFNVAVAAFTQVGDEPISRSDAEQVGQSIYNQLEAELTDLSGEIGVTVEIWEPDRTGVVRGETAEERAENAASLASRIQADVVIYGTVTRSGDDFELQPEFYLAIGNSYEVSELLGANALGQPVSVATRGENLRVPLSANSDFKDRSQMLSLLTRGLTYYLLNDYEQAQVLFEQANDDQFWASEQGREVMWLFVGNAAGQSFRLDEAEAAYRAGMDANPEYARIYLGLAGVNYIRSLSEVVSADPHLLEEELAQASDYYDQAIIAEDQPLTADISTKVAFGRGQISLVRFVYEEEPTDKNAIAQFNQVLADYGDGENPRVRELAAEAESGLAQIALHKGDNGAAIEHFEQAVNLTAVSQRDGFFLGLLADIYQREGNAAEAEAANLEAIKALEQALRVTSLDSRRATLYANISGRYVRLEQWDEAIEAMEQAAVLAPEDSSQQELYTQALADMRALAQ